MTTTTRHDHTTDAIVGYRVRHSLVDGVALGYDGPTVAEIDGAHRYSDAIEVAHRYRDGRGSYAVVDLVYADGCIGRA